MAYKVVDERSKLYSYAGDDKVNQAITGHHSSFIIHHSSFIIHHSSFINHFHINSDCIFHYLLDLVRGSLCSALKQILEQGLRPTSILGGTIHPWLFIQEHSFVQLSLYPNLDLVS